MSRLMGVLFDQNMVPTIPHPLLPPLLQERVEKEEKKYKRKMVYHINNLVGSFSIAQKLSSIIKEMALMFHLDNKNFGQPAHAFLSKLKGVAFRLPLYSKCNVSKKLIDDDMDGIFSHDIVHS